MDEMKNYSNLRKIELMKIYTPYITKEYLEKERDEMTEEDPIELVSNAPKEAFDALAELERRCEEEFLMGILSD
ncbi:MAG: hypothetical protein HDR54_04475 [Treponema sp.]|nr:hypothetical protein [Treponema sp.]MBD5408633.1 hypothetical protein [Treponema sp.]MBD5410752.1 hypothetical protein [Treponema sp.]MBD5442606.1 hypothetical protein [Treponema sp.]